MFWAVIGWEVYQVTLNKYPVMFWFENGRALLNVGNAFSLKFAGETADCGMVLVAGGFSTYNEIGLSAKKAKKLGGMKPFLPDIPALIRTRQY